MATRRVVQLGGTRMIRVLSAKWGANCRADGRGFFERDILLAAQRACNERTACDWTLRYQELDEIDPEWYSNYNQPTSSFEDQYSDTPTIIARRASCPRAMHVTYRCVGHGDPNLLYTNETRGATFEANVAAEAALGSVVHLECATPDPVLLPGGSLFADPQALGGSLRFKGPSHSGAFAYEKAGELRYVYTFRYWTDRSNASELGARRLYFDDDGWPVLEQDASWDWQACGSDAWHGGYAFEEGGDTFYYSGQSPTKTHCRYHANRGTYCVGTDVRATHPLVGAAPGDKTRVGHRAPELAAPGDTVVGQTRVDEKVYQPGIFEHGFDLTPEETARRTEETARAASPTMAEHGVDTPSAAAHAAARSWWAEREDLCDERVETQLGKALTCTRNAKGERIRGCSAPLCSLAADKCERDADGAPNAACAEGFACKKLPQRRVAAWDPADFFDGGVPVHMSRHGPTRQSAARAATPDGGACSATLRVSKIDPSSGGFGGGTRVTVYGTGFGAPARCRFGRLEVAAVEVAAHTLVCVTPLWPNASAVAGTALAGTSLAGSERSVPLELSMMSTDVLRRSPLPPVLRDGRGDNFTSDSRHFIFYESSLIRLSFVRPQGGPTAGGSHVDVHGAGFRFVVDGAVHGRGERHNVLCRFGRTRVPATVHNSHRLSCFAPPGLANGRVPLEVSFNAQEFTGGPADAAGFTYFTLSNHSADEAAVAAAAAAEEANTSLGICAQLRTMESLRARGLNCDAYHSEPALCEGAYMTVWHDWPTRSRGAAWTEQHGDIGYLSRCLYDASRSWHGRCYAEERRFRCAPPPADVIVSSIEPLGGPTRGGTLLTVRGVGFAHLDAPGGVDWRADDFNQMLYLQGQVEALPTQSCPPHAWTAGTATCADGAEPRDRHHQQHLPGVASAGAACLFVGVRSWVPGAARPGLPQEYREPVAATLVDSTTLLCEAPAHPSFDTYRVDASAEEEQWLSNRLMFGDDLATKLMYRGVDAGRRRRRRRRRSRRRRRRARRLPAAGGAPRAHPQRQPARAHQLDGDVLILPR